MTTTNSQDKILTIVVPVYNTEEYLPKCINSVLNCENKQDIELLIINDGSPDNSDAVLSQYAQDYPHIVRYIRKENGGWGSCINWAMREAVGKYFKILDSDDYYNTEALDHFIEYIRNLDEDLIISSMTELYSNGEYKTFNIPSRYAYKVSAAREHFTLCPFPMGMICYKTSVLQNPISFSERYYADIEFLMKPLLYIQTAAYVPYNVYQYNKTREDSSTTVRSYARNRSNFLTVVKDLIYFYNLHREELANKSELDSLFISELKVLSCSVYHLYLSTTYRFDDISCNVPELRSFYRYLKKHIPHMLKKLHHIRKKGLPYIWIWNRLHINVLKIRKLWM